MTARSSIERAPQWTFAETGGELLRYFGCSAAALAVDFGLFLTCIHLGAGYALAAAVGFLAGMSVAYSLSVRIAFRFRRLASPRVELVLFSVIGVLGVLLTEMLLWYLMERQQLGAVHAKASTAGIVFFFNFAARKFLLFTNRADSGIT